MIICQHYYSPSGTSPLMEISEPVHRLYSHKHNMDYFYDTSKKLSYDIRSYFEKCRLILELFANGYTEILFLDWDTLITDQTFDLRLCLPTYPNLISLYHNGINYNTGVMFVVKHPKTVELFTTAIAQGDCFDGMGGDQQRINDLIGKLNIGVEHLDRRFNDYLGTSNHVIRTWHNCPDKSNVVQDMSTDANRIMRFVYGALSLLFR